MGKDGVEMCKDENSVSQRFSDGVDEVNAGARIQPGANIKASAPDKWTASGWLLEVSRVMRHTGVGRFKRWLEISAKAVLLRQIRWMIYRPQVPVVDVTTATCCIASCCQCTSRCRRPSLWARKRSLMEQNQCIDIILV